jgi:hypothetical protein
MCIVQHSSRQQFSCNIFPVKAGEAPFLSDMLCEAGVCKLEYVSMAHAQLHRAMHTQCTCAWQ